MPRMTDDILANFLLEPHVGVISSLRRDGRPYSVPVWWLHDDGEFWVSGTSNRVWCKQLMADPRCSLCIEAMAPVPGFAGVDGNATVLLPAEFDIWPVTRRLVEKYIGRGDPANDSQVDAFFNNMQTEPRLLIRIEPEVRRAIDMRVYEGKAADRKHQSSE